MKQSIIYALDFDGVICDSAVETAMTGWKAAGLLWPDMPAGHPSVHQIERFRRARPMIETGYEAILAMRLIYLETDDNAVLNGFETNKQRLIDELNIDVESLKKLFGEIRDHWIRDALDEWIGVNPLFPGVAEKLRTLSAQSPWYVVTTKQERFVSQILNANRIELSDDKIFGLDRKKSKEEILIELAVRHPGETLVFIEDRLPTLLNVLRNPALQSVRLQLADWGYNTARDRQDAESGPLEIINIENFLAMS